MSLWSLMHPFLASHMITILLNHSTIIETRKGTLIKYQELIYKSEANVSN